MFSIIKNKWKRKDIIILLERIEIYFSSGLEINKTLMIIEDSLKAKQKTSISKLIKHIESGLPLYGGLENIIGISRTTAGLIEYGELSGSLTKALLMAKTLLEKEEELFKKCINALIYPSVIGVFAILLTIGLVRGVMSQIIPLLKSLKVDLPFITRLTISISEIINNYGLYILIALIILLLSFKFINKRYIRFRRFFQYLLIKIPLFGSLIYSYYLAIFLHSCGALVESGLFIGDSYKKTLNTTTFLPLKDLLEDGIDKIYRGVSLGSILTNKRIPSFITSLISAGQISGNLGSSIIRSGNILDKNLDHSLKKFTALIEPMMMIGMGCIVGTIALSIMIPIYNISSSLQK
jgi:type IV pilus assembly protein PilC